MASYTIEDIELIRRKSGISYQEAVSLLDYHNGNVARALVDLERNGRLKPDAAAQDAPKSAEKESVHRCCQQEQGRLHALHQQALPCPREGGAAVDSDSQHFAAVHPRRGAH
ncbi:MAG: hypothetical protein ACLTXW_08490 [Christensenellales bacterium]